VNTDAPDPGVLLYKGVYYVVTTSGNAAAAFPIRTSTDLVNWTFRGFVFPEGKLPAWASQRSFWAPEIHLVGSNFIVYFVGRDHTGTLCVGAAFASHPLGPYTYLSFLIFFFFFFL
jgi:beta-xylosidase